MIVALIILAIVVLGAIAVIEVASLLNPTPPPTPPTPNPQPPVPTPVPVPPTPVPGAKTIAWINESQGTLADADAARIVEALNLQVPHLEKAWSSVGVNHVVATLSNVPAGAVKAYFLPNADVAGALGYHDVDPQGDPYIRVFTETVLSAGGTALAGALSIAVCASHEACEEACDPGCQATATAANGDVWALEVADPVENNYYEVVLADGTHVSVSDFVTPAFFDTKATGGFDQTGVLKAPFTIAPGGYAIVNNQQVFGESYPEAKKAMKEFPVARTYRRIRGNSMSTAA